MSCCCKYCMLQNKKNVKYLSEADFEDEKRSLRREMGHLRVNDIALLELVEELQRRVEQAQDRIQELQRWVLNSYVLHPGRINVQSDYTLSTTAADVTHQFTPFDLYRRYLVGDYDDEGKFDDEGRLTRGWLSDEKIMGHVYVKPKNPKDFEPFLKSIQTEDVNYVDPEGDGSGRNEVHRPKERIWVKGMFTGIGSESGALESELSEYYEMIEQGGEMKAAAEEQLIRLYSQGVMDSDDATSDTEELEEQGG